MVWLRVVVGACVYAASGNVMDADVEQSVSHSLSNQKERI